MRDRGLPDLSEMLRGLPADHPAREESMLTPHQAMALPVLMWLFDPQRSRASGKSYVLAVAAIELAMRGYNVLLEEPSFEKAPFQRHQHFMRLVEQMTRERYREHKFVINLTDRTLRYVGVKPR